MGKAELPEHREPGPPRPEADRIRDRLTGLWTGRFRELGESLGASVGVQIALFGSGIITARSLGPTGRGDLAVLLVLPSVALQLATLGLPSAVTYYVARNKPAAWPIT